jgi:hypothetical protein
MCLSNFPIQEKEAETHRWNWNRYCELCIIFDIFNEEKSENYDEDGELQEENWNNYENIECQNKQKNSKI